MKNEMTFENKRGIAYVKVVNRTMNEEIESLNSRVVFIDKQENIVLSFGITYRHKTGHESDAYSSTRNMQATGIEEITSSSSIQEIYGKERYEQYKREFLREFTLARKELYSN